MPGSHGNFKGFLVPRVAVAGTGGYARFLERCVKFQGACFYAAGPPSFTQVGLRQGMRCIVSDPRRRWPKKTWFRPIGPKPWSVLVDANPIKIALSNPYLSTWTLPPNRFGLP